MQVRFARVDENPKAPIGFGEFDDDFVLGPDWAETEGGGEDNL